MSFAWCGRMIPDGSGCDEEVRLQMTNAKTLLLESGWDTMLLRLSQDQLTAMFHLQMVEEARTRP